MNKDILYWNDRQTVEQSNVYSLRVSLHEHQHGVEFIHVSREEHWHFWIMNNIHYNISVEASLSESVVIWISARKQPYSGKIAAVIKHWNRKHMENCCVYSMMELRRKISGQFPNWTNISSTESLWKILPKVTWKDLRNIAIRNN